MHGKCAIVHAKLVTKIFSLQIESVLFLGRSSENETLVLLGKAWTTSGLPLAAQVVGKRTTVFVKEDQTGTHVHMFFFAPLHTYTQTRAHTSTHTHCTRAQYTQ